MRERTIPPPDLDRAVRLNAALLAQGRLAVTTDATGCIDLPMLLATVQGIGMSVETRGPDGAGVITVTVGRAGRAPGAHAVLVSASSVSRTVAVVEAAIAALTALPAPAG